MVSRDGSTSSAPRTPEYRPGSSADTLLPMKAISDEQLRADIRRLGNQLGDALVRQHGPELLESGRKGAGHSASRCAVGGSTEASDKLDGLLSDLERRRRDRPGAGVHHLLLPGQRHRAGASGRPAGHRRSLSDGATVDRILEAEVDEGELAEVLSTSRGAAGLHGPPHRGRSTLDPEQDRQLADLIEQRLEVRGRRLAR